MAAEFFRLALEDEDLPPVDPFCDVISNNDAACCDDRPSFGLIGGPPSLLKDNGPASCPLALSPDEPTEGSFSTPLMDAGPRQGPSFDARSMNSIDDS